jgi:hypothetical protein
MLNKITLYLLLATIVVSCEKEDPPLFTIAMYNLLFQVDPTLQPPFTYYVPINDVKTNALSIIKGNGFDTSRMKNIRPLRASFNVIFDDSDLDFIDVVSVRICPQGVNTQNCGREVFYRDPVPFKPGNDLNLVPSNIDDIRDILLKEKVNVQVKFERLRGFPTKTFSIRLDMDFGVR